MDLKCDICHVKSWINTNLMENKVLIEMKVPHYLAGQYLGAFLASCTVFLVYWDALVWYEHDRGGYRTTPDTAAIFSTYPAPHLTLGGGILDQVTVTAMLLLCVCAITDTRNMKVGKFFSPKLKRPFAVLNYKKRSRRAPILR